MLKHFSVLLCAAVILSSLPAVSQSKGLLGTPPEGEVSVFDYGLNGMGLGFMAGLSAGYIRYKDGTDKGREILTSGLYGTLFGAGLGLVLGTLDASQGKMDTGARILFNMKRGGKFGLLVGTLWGGINALNKDDTKLLGEGAAWGYIGGAVFGALVSFVKPSSSSSRANAAASVVFMRDSRDNAFPALMTQYNF